MQTVLKAQDQFLAVLVMRVLDSEHFARAVVELDFVGGHPVEQRLVKIDAVEPDDVPQPVA